MLPRQDEVMVAVPKLSDRWINKVERRHEPPTTNVVESVTPEERDYISSMKWLEEGELARPEE